MSMPLNSKPLLVRVTIWLFGALAIVSLLACCNFAEDLPAQNVANVLRASAATLAFISAISGTRIGYKVVIVVLGFAAIGACFGIYAGLKILYTKPLLGMLSLVISVGVLAWFYMYTFGKATRAYFSKQSWR